ncbi:sensor histidine kinase KdpD [Pedobacter sp. ASV28]|uniref:sensor histidine kinase n=1 Tax=Pedobacter sp. ASV28 TaxID=2795123 RepID=UPI0018EDBC20|nr:HAMP domain-containing sensor histidine kinase [Pedobacter sp. ASV28]
MLKLLTYHTPIPYRDDFRHSNARDNFRLVKMMSLCGFILALVSRITAFLYYKDLRAFPNYEEYSLSNMIILVGHLCFYLGSLLISKYQSLKHFFSLCFVVFLLLSSLYVSYVNSMHNTKNTLTMLLIGIVLAGLFFLLELKHILVITVLLMLCYWFSIVSSKISFFDKVLNICAGLTLGLILFFISRYSYYLKSKSFIRIKQLEEKNKEIAMLNRQKSEVLAYVAHDLRSPLSSIQMLNRVQPDEYPEFDVPKLIEEATQQADNIIGDLLEALKENTDILTTQRLELGSFIKAMVEKWRNNTGRSIHFVKSTHLVYAFINSSKMERVLDNLIQNAIKFSPVDQPIEVVLTKREKLEIEIKDRGIGIPSNMINEIFKQFTPVGRMGLGGEKSIGIGLHLSKKIIEQHKGTITVHSTEGLGTTFTVQLEPAY